MKKITIAHDSGSVNECHIATKYEDLPYKVAMKVLEYAYCRPQTTQNQLIIWSHVFVAPASVKSLLLEPQHRDELLQLLNETDWAWQTGYEKRPLASLTAGGKLYLLPDEDLRQLTLGEFITATAYLIAFSSAGGDNILKSTYLAQFVATIARPRLRFAQRVFRSQSAANGDQREQFNSHSTEGRTAVFRSVELSLKVAIMQWFLAAVARMGRLYGMPAPELEEKNPLTLGVFVQDWERTVHSLAREQNFGNYDAVMGRSVHEVMAYLEIKKNELNEHEDEVRRQRNSADY